MTIWIPMRRVAIALPEKLLVQLDEAAKDYYMSRSEYIRLELHKAVKKHYERQIQNLHRTDNIPEGLENDPRMYDLDDS